MLHMRLKIPHITTTRPPKQQHTQTHTLHPNTRSCIPHSSGIKHARDAHHNTTIHIHKIIAKKNKKTTLANEPRVWTKTQHKKPKSIIVRVPLVEIE